jgi:hypothetical protein
MEERDGDGNARIVAEIATEIHRFVQQYPNHYAATALTALVNRAVAGETVSNDERELVLLTLAREAKRNAGQQRFGPPRLPPPPSGPVHQVDENA